MLLKICIQTNRFSIHFSNFTANIVFFCASNSPGRALSGHQGNLRMMEIQRGHSCITGQTPVVTLPVSTQLPQSKHFKKASAMVIHSLNLTDSLQTAVKQGTGALLRKTEKESLSQINVMINQQSRTLEDKVHIEDCDLSIVSTQTKAPKMDAQGITMSVHDQLSARIAAAETFTSTEYTKEMVSEANKKGTNNQTEIPKAKLNAEEELKQGLYCVTQTVTDDPTKQTATVLKTEPVILAQTDISKGSEQTKTPSETLRDTEKSTVTLYKTSGPHLCRATEAAFEVSGELFKDIEAEAAEAEGTSLVTSRVTENKEPGTVITLLSSTDSNSHSESKTANTEILKKEDLIVNKEVNNYHETKEIKVAPTLQYFISLSDQEVLLNTAESKELTSLTDSGVALSLSDPEELLSPGETDVFLSPAVSCSSPEIFPESFETAMSCTDQVFCQVDPDDNVKRHDLLLSPNDRSKFLSRNESKNSLSPIDTNRLLGPNHEEEIYEACLPEAKAHMRPVEKYFLSTQGQSLSFSGKHAFPERDRNRRVTISVRGVDSLCFGSFEGNEEKSSSTGDLGFRTSCGCSVLADNGGQLDFDMKTSRDRHKNSDSVGDIKVAQSPEGRCDSENQKEIPLPMLGRSVDRSLGDMAASNSKVPMDHAANFNSTIANSSGTINSNAESVLAAGVQRRFRCKSGECIAYSGSLGRKSSLDSDTSLTSKWAKEGPLLATRPATSQETRRFCKRGSSLYGSVSLLKEGSGQSQSVATNPVTINPPQGRFGKRESGEWVAYGGSFQQKHSVNNGLFRTEGEGSAAMDMLQATSQPGTGKFDSRRCGEWMPTVVHLATSPPQIRRYGNRGNGERMVCDSRDSSENTDSKECLPLTTNLATSPPGTGRFGIGGSGKWMVYGGHTGRTSSLVASHGLANAESTESLSVARQLATSPQAVPRAGRFGSGSREWRVYGGSTGSLGGAGGEDSISVRASEGQRISLPSSYTQRRQRFSSAGSGGRVNSGKVIRRSCSVGCSGRLSSSGSGGKLSSSPSSHTVSSAGNFSIGSDELRPIYSSGSGHTSNVEIAGQSSGRTIRSGRTSVSGSGGDQRLSGSTNNGLPISRTGSSSGICDRISQASGGLSSSSATGRTNRTGGRVINDQPIRNTGNGAKGNKERMSVCKMAALSISAAGRKRSQERRRPAQQP